MRLPGRTGRRVSRAYRGHRPRRPLRLARARPLQTAGSGHRFNCAKLLVDPFATRLDQPFMLDASLFDARIHGAAADDIDSAPFVPKAIVEAPEPFQPPRRPSVEWRDLVIYEMHVRGFTKLHPDIPESIRGTFAGLAHEASIDYLKRLGVTAVELVADRGMDRRAASAAARA